jgi:glutamate--cysteine ligase
MSRPPESQGAPILDRRQLIEDMESGCAPKSEWRVGTEHEKFVYRLSDLRPVAYEGPDGIRAVLNGMTRFGWEPVLENGNPIALVQGKCAITLEPGGQFELSGAPLDTIHETCDEVHVHLAQVREVCDELGVGMMGLGFQPKWQREDHSWMPKGRYKIMREQMQRKGELGVDMMIRTCTVQANVDFESESDMVEKLRISLALQPINTALFANSPFMEGKPNGFQSYRSHIWTDTDPERCGTLPFVFEDGFGFERYVDYLLDVPMYFVYRDDQYLDVAGKSFRDFMAGRLEGFEGQIPYMGDWSDHMTTSFPEVRLKKYIEMRGADGGPWGRLCAQAALWVGLLYDSDAQQAAWDLVKDWTEEEREAMRRDVPRLGLKMPFRGGTLQDIAKQVVDIARHGLRKRARLDAGGSDETGFLTPLAEIAETGRSPAEVLLDAYKNEWGGDIDEAFEAEKY